MNEERFPGIPKYLNRFYKHSTHAVKFLLTDGSILFPMEHIVPQLNCLENVERHNRSLPEYDVDLRAFGMTVADFELLRSSLVLAGDHGWQHFQSLLEPITDNVEGLMLWMYLQVLDFLGADHIRTVLHEAIVSGNVLDGCSDPVRAEDALEEILQRHDYPTAFIRTRRLNRLRKAFLCELNATDDIDAILSATQCLTESGTVELEPKSVESQQLPALSPALQHFFRASTRCVKVIMWGKSEYNYPLELVSPLVPALKGVEIEAGATHVFDFRNHDLVSFQSIHSFLCSFGRTEVTCVILKGDRNYRIDIDFIRYEQYQPCTFHNSCVNHHVQVNGRVECPKYGTWVKVYWPWHATLFVLNGLGLEAEKAGMELSINRLWESFETLPDELEDKMAECNMDASQLVAERSRRKKLVDHKELAAGIGAKATLRRALEAQKDLATMETALNRLRRKS